MICLQLGNKQELKVGAFPSTHLVVMSTVITMITKDLIKQKLEKLRQLFTNMQNTNKTQEQETRE